MTQAGAQLPEQPMTSDEFLEWVTREEPGRVELIDGYVVPKDIDPETGMAGGTKLHGAVKGNAYLALRNGLRGSGCNVYVDELIVRAADASSFIPDVLVECPEVSVPGENESKEPIIIVEVLSKTTRAHDLSIKLNGYFSILSLQHYLIVDAEKRLVILHSRVATGIATSILHGGTVALDPPGCTVDLDVFWEEIPQ